VKLLAVAALVLLAPGADVRFEREGVRVGDALVQGSVLELKGTGAASLLASASTVEALVDALDVEVASGRSIRVEPGLRLTREGEGYRLSTHGNRKIRLEASGARLVTEGPVRVVPTTDGWIVGETTLAGAALRAGLQVQDDAGQNLDRMLQAKEKMSTTGVPKLSSRRARLFRGNPLTAGEAADSISVRTIIQVSPSGAP
jgi:hypothetical protein